MPLVTKKRADFLLFKGIVGLINEGGHLTSEGLAEIVSIKASMNKGLGDKLKLLFPNTSPVDRPQVEDPVIKDPN